MSSPVVVIAASEAERVQAKVCEWSIRKHLRPGEDVRIIHTIGMQLPRWSGRQGTPFSFVRFMVPELAAPAPRAIYLDSDMLLFAPIQELWDTPQDGKAVLRTEDPSVLIVDCKAVRERWRLQAIMDALEAKRIRYGDLMSTLNLLPPEEVGQLPPEWNHIDRFQAGWTKLLHFSNLDRQPWKFADHQHGDQWYPALEAAIRAGYVPLAWLKDLPTEIVQRKLFHGRLKCPA
jgi:Glycosyl transferase family 8